MWFFLWGLVCLIEVSKIFGGIELEDTGSSMSEKYKEMNWFIYGGNNLELKEIKIFWGIQSFETADTYSWYHPFNIIDYENPDFADEKTLDITSL
jgi:hypothetical protein